MKYKKLTPSQLNIMKTLWDKKEPMIASDFVQLDPSLNLNSVQSALRSLLKKNYIEVSDIVYSGKVLTRRYIPVVSSEDYLSLCILQKQTIYLKKRNLCDLSCCRSCHDPYAFALEFSFCSKC